MAKFTDTQLLILSSAAQRDDLTVELPPTMPEAAGKKAVGQLRKRGFLDEVVATTDMPVWRREENGPAFSLVVTETGLDAIGITPEERRPELELGVPGAPRKRGAGVSPKKQPDANGLAPELAQAPREGSKLDGVLALLRQPGGASIAQMIEATGWLPHTTRAALTGLRKRGYSIERSPGSDGNTSYRLASAPASDPTEGLSGASMHA